MHCLACFCATQLLFVVFTHIQPANGETWVKVSFFPPISPDNVSAGLFALHVRSRDLLDRSQLSKPYITAEVVPSVCQTYTANTSVEVFCRRKDVSAGISPTECDSGDDRPCSLEDVTLLDASTVQRFRVQETLEFSWFSCTNLSSHWYDNPACDTQEPCYSKSPETRSTTAGCETCAWDCAYGLQCFYSTGLPPLPYAQDADAPYITPCRDQNNCRYYCCSEQRRIPVALDSAGNAASRVAISMTCTFVPQKQQSGSAVCGSSSRLSELCNSSASIVLRTLAGSGQTQITVENVEPYRCQYDCDYPCTTPKTLQLSECDPVSKLCTPNVVNAQVGGVHDKMCTVNFLLDKQAVCDNGEQPVAYKNQAKCDALGLSAFDDIGVGFAYGSRTVCTEYDYLGCDAPLCRCQSPQGCPSHPNCSGHGTLYDTDVAYLDDYYTPPVCVCDPGYFTRFCAFRRDSTAPECARGQELV